MITLRKAEHRGHLDFGWLNTKHSFSFGSYYDPEHMGFSALRVINDDIIQPNTGFDTHGHRDMEIITYIIQGAIRHQDSEGNVEILPAGEFQLMSAGKGIYHSEYNASDNEPLQLLQIWIEPNTRGGKPSYQQKDFGQEFGLTTIATPNGENGALQIKQDATLRQLILAPNQSLEFDIPLNRNVYIQQVQSELLVDGITISAGDGAKVEHQTQLELHNPSTTNSTALIFELP